MDVGWHALLIMAILETYEAKYEGADVVSALILCGGKSQRMGQNKAQLALGQRTFLTTAKDTVRRAGIANVVSVGQKGCDVVDDIAFCGPGAALISALYQLNSKKAADSDIEVTASKNNLALTEIVLVLPVDMPLLTPSSIHFLLDKARETKQSVYFENECFPLVIYNVYCHQHKLRALKNSVASPSMRAVINAVGAVGIPTPTAIKPTLLNVNTPHEYALIS